MKSEFEALQKKIIDNFLYTAIRSKFSASYYADFLNDSTTKSTSSDAFYLEKKGANVIELGNLFDESLITEISKSKLLEIIINHNAG